MAEKFSYQPEYPIPGQEINISYNPSGTILEDMNEINLTAYCFPRGIPDVKEITMEKSKKSRHGSFTTTDSTLAVYLVFRSDEQQDDTIKIAYLIPLFTADKKPVRGGMARLAEVAFYRGPCPYMRRDWETVKEYLRKEFEFYPDQVQKSAHSYWYPMDNLHRDSAIQIIRRHLEKIGLIKEKVSTAYGLSGIPALFIIDQRGNIRFGPEHNGLNEKEFIEHFRIMIDLLR